MWSEGIHRGFEVAVRITPRGRSAQRTYGNFKDHDNAGRRCGELPGQLVVVSGPSGCGKSTVIRRALAQPETRISSSRSPRRPADPGRASERRRLLLHGAKTSSRRSAIANEFLEWPNTTCNFYGTPAAPVYDALAGGRRVLLEIEVEGALQVRRKVPDAFFVFIKAPSFRSSENA